MARSLPFLVLIAAAALAAFTGCAGYRSDSLFPAGARRIAVPIFGNKTYFRQIEFQLTKSVHEEIRSRPGIHLVDAADADIVLEGEITDVDQSVLAITRSSEGTRLNESSATTRVNCTVKDGRTGQVIRRFSKDERVDFALATGEGLQTAQREAFYELARKIVFELEADW